MRYISYVWPSLLLVAALLAPDMATTITLLIGGIASIVLVVAREQKIARLVLELSDLLSIEQKTTSVALERSLQNMQRQMMLLAVIGELIVFVCMLTGRLDITVARSYALLVLVALSPLSLEIELRYLLSKKRGSETVRTAIGYATEDARALLTIIGLSLLGTVTLQIPPAISALQILFITCVARLVLSGRALQSLPYKADQTWRVTMTSTVCYGMFIFYFVRHYIDPRYVDSVNPLTLQAMTVTMATFIACQAIIVLFEAKRLSKLRLGLLIVFTLLICYVTPLARYFGIVAPAPDDWLWVLLASTSYGALYAIRHRRSASGLSPPAG